METFHIRSTLMGWRGVRGERESERECPCLRCCDNWNAIARGVDAAVSAKHRQSDIGTASGRAAQCCAAPYPTHGQPDPAQSKSNSRTACAIFSNNVTRDGWQQQQQESTHCTAKSEALSLTSTGGSSSDKALLIVLLGCPPPPSVAQPLTAIQTLTHHDDSYVMWLHKSLKCF